jgi:TolA-binding protein
MRPTFALAALAVLVPLTLRAQPMIQSQEGIALENQILQLQQQVQQLQSNSGGGGSALGGAQQSTPSDGSTAAPQSSVVTNLLNQVQQLQSQVATLNGEVDTLQNQVTTQNAQMEKQIGDLNFKVNGTASPGAPPPSSGAPATLTPPAPPPQAAASPTGTPKELLHDGLSAYEKGNYTAAEAAARSILTNANSSPQAYRAQYLLAQALAGENRPQDAAIAYDDAYNRDRTGSEAPESLLGLANSLADINQNEAACDTLASLQSQFPTPPAGMAARIAATQKRASCS